MLKCSSNKKTYLSEGLAEDALLHAHTQFDYSRGGGPVSVYRCEECGNFHLTSKGSMHIKLANYLKGKTSELNREAQHWLRKLKL